MASWVLVPCLVSLRAEFNALSPGRDKGADGSIGDSNHTSSSDHTPDEDSSVLDGRDSDNKNEVHAGDIDSTGPWPRPFRSIVMDIIAGERRKWLSSTDMCRLDYVIFDRKIYSRSRDFMPVSYNGSDPHTNHAHFSARYLTSTENDTRPFIPQEDTPMADTIRTWSNDTVLAVNWLLSEAYRAAAGEADGTSAADRNARNVHLYLRKALTTPHPTE